MMHIVMYTKSTLTLQDRCAAVPHVPRPLLASSPGSSSLYMCLDGVDAQLRVDVVCPTARVKHSADPAAGAEWSMLSL